MADSSYSRLTSFQQNQAASSVASVVVTVNNAILILISSVILLCSQKEEPPTPVRTWIYGYIVLCLLQLFISWAGSCSSDLEGVTGAACCKSLLGCLVIVWWVVGIWWVSSGGHALLTLAPHLFWLTVVLLAMPLIIVAVGICCVCLTVTGLAAATSDV